MEGAGKRSGPKASNEPGSPTPGDRPELEAASDPPSVPDSKATRIVGSDSEATQSLGAKATGPAPSTSRNVRGVPVRWGPLELLEKLGEGGFGETFRARDTRLDREVALKLLKPEASGDEAVSGRVIREGALLARVRHPNVVIVYGAERTEGRVGLWMELVKGRTLESLVSEQGPLGEREAVLVGVDLCRALAAVHGAGIIHRDIKAANVMREEGGRIVLMDFGLGVDLRAEEAGAAGPTAGTPFYMAPELLRGAPATVRSDLYSVGVLLFRLVTGRYPLTGRTVVELREGHEARRAVRVRDARADLSAEFVRVVERCLAREPERRFETPGALEAALMDTLGALGPLGAEGAGPEAGRAAGAGPAVLREYRKGRVAEWSQPRYRLDKEFVALTLLVDQGEESAAGRWSARPERYRDLGELLAAVEEPALVLLGPPGCGKSTLLRRLELDLAQEALSREEDRTAEVSPETAVPGPVGGPGENGAPVSFFIQLNHYRPLTSKLSPALSRAGRDAQPSARYPDPAAWLAERWRGRFPEMPPLPSLLAEGRVVLLLDALNEIPAAGASDLREAVLLWKEFLDLLVSEHPGNRVFFSCRTLDYSAPLSTPSLRVPQVVIEPMTDAQVEQYLVKHAASRAEEGPGHAQTTGATTKRGAEIWRQLRGTPQLEVMRSPYFLSLVVDQVEVAGGIPLGRAGLFTGFVRQALKREIERDNPLFSPNGLLTERDLRRIAQGRWGTPSELPERGVLIPKLSDLAFRMQDRSGGGGSSQVRVAYDEALATLDHERGEDIVRAGVALSVLDEDAAQDEVLFYHQLVQEYFAGRRLAVAPEPGRVETAWKAEEIAPPLVEVLRLLPPSETLPALPTTGWEETALLAGEMARHPDPFVRGLMGSNLALAGRCAAQAEVRGRLSPEILEDLRRALVARSRDRLADLRARIEAGLALGPLGDPRFERRRGPHGDYLMPPLVEIPAGRYPIGEDEPHEHIGSTWTDHMPRHEVEMEAFRIGRFPVTNAEWALFMQAGGYEEERWWDALSARRWQSGEGTSEGMHASVRYWLGRFRKDPDQVEKLWAAGQWTEANYERWKKRLAMSEAELEAHLRELYPGGKLREPLYWRDATWNNPSQPVAGICWFEARSYANWLSAQVGESFRLPTEAEWEAAARGREGRLYAYGNEFVLLKGNTSEARIHGTTPVGVFVEGDTPEGVSDMTGNVEEWTSSLFGTGAPAGPATFRYPYRADDGREDPSAGTDVRRVLRGSATSADRVSARAAVRTGYLPASRGGDGGLRLAAAVASSISA